MNSYGTPAGTLRGTNAGRFATSDRAHAGRRGELAVASLLAKVFHADPTVHVFHDVTIPTYRANVDHVVVRGDKVLLLDDKRWKGGFYWTVAGRTFRGRERTAWADKNTLPAAERLFGDYLRPLAADATITSAMVIVPAGRTPVRTLTYRPPGNTPVKNSAKPIGGWLRARVRTQTPDIGPMLRAILELTKRPDVVALHGQVA